MKKLFFCLCLLFSVTSCDVMQNVAGTYGLSQCKYKYNSISNLNLAGINLQGATGLSSLNPLAMATLLAGFSKGSLPMQFTLNLNVSNPNYQTAILNGLQYVLEIDNMEMTTGNINSKMQIATGQIVQLPIDISFDLKKTMKGETGEAIKNLAFNFAGLGNKASNVTVRLKPTLELGGQLVPCPLYIPISFTYGKNQ